MNFYKVPSPGGYHYQVFANSPKDAIEVLKMEWADDMGEFSEQVIGRPRLMTPLQVFNSAGFNIRYFGLEQYGWSGAYRKRKQTNKPKAQEAAQ